MEFWLIVAILIDLAATGWYFTNRIDENERKIKSLEHSIYIMNRRLKELDGIEVEQIEQPENRHTVTILLDPEGGAPEIKVDDD